MSELWAGSSLKEFFRAVLSEAVSRQRLELQQMTEFYLVNLLSDFATSDRLYLQANGQREEEPLAVMYARAMQSEREERIRTLRRLGDVSLYKVGFFSSALQRGPVGPDYYIQMGGTAYAQVADLARGGFGEVYRELCAKFRALVDVLEEIAARGLAQGGPGGAIKVYERWRETGNARLEEVLRDVGLLGPRGALPN